MLEGALQCWDASPLLEGKGVSDENEPALESTERRGLPVTLSARSIHWILETTGRSGAASVLSLLFSFWQLLFVTKRICFPVSSRFHLSISWCIFLLPCLFISVCLFPLSRESLSLYNSELRVRALCHRDMLLVGLPWIQDSLQFFACHWGDGIRW